MNFALVIYSLAKLLGTKARSSLSVVLPSIIFWNRNTIGIMYLHETRDGGCYLSLTGKAELVNIAVYQT